MTRTGWVAVTVGLVVLCVAVVALAGCPQRDREDVGVDPRLAEGEPVAVGQDVETALSHLGNEGPAWTPKATPSKLGWGPDDQAYPDRFVVDPEERGEYVWVPAGKFMMGSADDDPDARDDEKPRHRVRITRGFWLGKHTVTNAQYRAFCAATGQEFPEPSDQGDDHPVVGVHLVAARVYARRYGLRLPTEAEWEHAARGPEGRQYPWGDEWDPARLCWGERRGPGGRTFPVGSFPAGASWVGALDMAGNVYEWVWDWYGRDYYARSPVKDPRGPSEAEATLVRIVPTGEIARTTVLRGGCWDTDDPRFYRCAFRGTGLDLGLGLPSFRYASLGFRCVRGPEVAGK